MNILICFALPAKPFAVRRPHRTSMTIWQRLCSRATQVLRPSGPDQLDIAYVLIVQSDDV